MRLIAKKLHRFLLMFLTGFTSLSVLLLFFSIDHLLCLFGWFLILFYLTKMRFSWSTHLLMCLSLETLTSTTKTHLPILAELIDIVSSVIVFLSQTTLLKWLAFLLRYQTMILSPALLDSFISSDASICSIMAFPPLGNSDHVVVSVSFDFPSFTMGLPNSLHFLWLFSCWLGLSLWSLERWSMGGYLQTHSVLLLLLVIFVSRFRLELMYISLTKSIR